MLIYYLRIYVRTKKTLSVYNVYILSPIFINLTKFFAFKVDKVKIG